MFTISIIIIAICIIFLIHDVVEYYKAAKMINDVLERCFASLKEREDGEQIKDNC